MTVVYTEFYQKLTVTALDRSSETTDPREQNTTHTHTKHNQVSTI